MVKKIAQKLPSRTSPEPTNHSDIYIIIVNNGDVQRELLKEKVGTGRVLQINKKWINLSKMELQ